MSGSRLEYPVALVTSTVPPAPGGSSLLKRTPDHSCSVHHPPVQSRTATCRSCHRASSASDQSREVPPVVTVKRHDAGSSSGTWSNSHDVAGIAVTEDEASWNDPVDRRMPRRDVSAPVAWTPASSTRATAVSPSETDERATRQVTPARADATLQCVGNRQDHGDDAGAHVQLHGRHPRAGEQHTDDVGDARDAGPAPRRTPSSTDVARPGLPSSPGPAQPPAHHRRLPRHQDDHQEGDDPVEDGDRPDRSAAQQEHHEPGHGRQRDDEQQGEVRQSTVHRRRDEAPRMLHPAILHPAGAKP